MEDRNSRPSDPVSARDQGLALHEEIRIAIRRVLDLAGRVKRSDHGACIALPRAMMDLALKVRRHVAEEQRDVAPAVEEIDAWGALRREDLERAHSAEIEAVFQVDYYGSHLAMADEALAVVRALLRAMRFEERSVFAGLTSDISPPGQAFS